MWNLYLDPMIPEGAIQLAEEAVVRRIALGQIRADAWLSHPERTEGKIVRAIKVLVFREHFIQYGKSHPEY